jgi:hypothetical protein
MNYYVWYVCGEYKGELVGKCLEKHGCLVHGCCLRATCRCCELFVDECVQCCAHECWLV